MIKDDRIFRACIGEDVGELRWQSRDELEATINGLDSKQADTPDGGNGAAAAIADGVRAVLAAGCDRKRLNQLWHKRQAFFVPPASSINPAPEITRIEGHADDIAEFIASTQATSKSTPLSVTQLWWLRKERERVQQVLLRHGSALTTAAKHITVHSRSPALLSQCQHHLFMILADFVDCKIRTARPPDDLLLVAASYRCLAVWHDGVLEVQGAKQLVHSLVSAHTCLAQCDAKLIACHPLTDKDFICGKKDGKLVRIMRQCGARIDLRDHPQAPEHFLQLSVAGPAFEAVWRAAGLVDDELPTVFVGHVDDQWHRRLIGHAGKNIQRIMKRHGVYVKFFGRKDAEREFGGADEWAMPAHLFAQPNVVIKTPSKNGKACGAAFQDIQYECEMVSGAERTDKADAEECVEAADDVAHIIARIKNAPPAPANLLVTFGDDQWRLARFPGPASYCHRAQRRHGRSYSESDADMVLADFSLFLAGGGGSGGGARLEERAESDAEGELFAGWQKSPPWADPELPAIEPVHMLSCTSAERLDRFLELFEHRMCRRRSLGLFDL